MSTSTERLRVNGSPVDLEKVPQSERLLDTLRWRLALRGTKEGCRSGSCGSCTVLVDGKAALSCLVLSHELGAAEVTTIEAAASDPIGARVQAAFASESALQCGYCTPGFVMAAVGRLKESVPDDSADAAWADLQGNLCRCTGYAAIERAVRRAWAERR